MVRIKNNEVINEFYVNVNSDGRQARERHFIFPDGKINPLRKIKASSAYLGYCVTPSNYGLYPRYIAERSCRKELLAGRPHWHDTVAYTIV
jgi:hypothetical protein